MSPLQDVFQCDRPVALVTGSGAPRVGREIAHWMAAEGCRIVLHSHTSLAEARRTASRWQEEHQVDVVVAEGSLDDASVPQRLVDLAVERFERIDILVNSAAIWHPTPLSEITPDEMRNYFNINTLASFLCARAAAAVMTGQPSGGSIVNIGDWATVRPYLDHAAYFPSNGAIEVMTRSLAVEFAQANPRVRVNCILPGPVLLPDDVSDERREKVAASTLVRRVGTPQHVAHAVKFLCENDFVTGVCLPVDGGRQIYAPDGMQVGMNTG